MAGADEGVRGLAKRFRRVEEATDGIDGAMSEEQLQEDSARWQDLAQAGGELALAAAKGEIGGLTEPAVALVRALLDVEEAQARLLKSIDENVKLLRDGPFETGRLYLREAERLVKTPERALEFVDRAQQSFYQAHALAKEPVDRAAVEMHIALAAILLGQPEDAQHWLEQAYEKAAAKAQELARDTGNTKVIQGKGIKQAATAYATFGVSAAMLAVKKTKRSRSNKRAQNGLLGVLPLVACIASLHAATGADPGALPALQLIEVSDDQYELVAISS